MSKYGLKINPNKTTYADIVLAKILGKPIVPKADDILVLPTSEYEWFECTIGNMRIWESGDKATIKIGEITRGTSNLWSDSYDSDAIMSINGHFIQSNKEAWENIIPF